MGQNSLGGRQVLVHVPFARVPFGHLFLTHSHMVRGCFHGRRFAAHFFRWRFTAREEHVAQLQQMCIHPAELFRVQGGQGIALGVCDGMCQKTHLVMPQKKPLHVPAFQV